jgi:histidyl-tRNA synthetase
MDQKEKIKEKQEPFRAPKGMHDVVPADEPYWEKIEGAARSLARAYSFGRLEPPILEDAALYDKTSGEESDVVKKEMYAFRTKGGDLLALRPEYTPGICRAYLEHGMSRLPQPQKLFYFGPVFRHDRPQLGRYRQFTQIGFEILGGQNDPHDRPQPAHRAQNKKSDAQDKLDRRSRVQAELQAPASELLSEL